MPYGENEIRTMQGIHELTPAFQEFSELVLNKLTAAKYSFQLIDKKDTTTAQIEKHVATGSQALEQIETLFRELGK